jgi:hypothetical protein
MPVEGVVSGVQYPTGFRVVCLTIDDGVVYRLAVGNPEFVATWDGKQVTVGDMLERLTRRSAATVRAEVDPQRDRVGECLRVRFNTDQ